MILTADKGVCLVVMDKKDYIEKSEELLSKSTYKILPSDPTTRHKNKLIALLKSIKAEGGMQENTYKKLYSTGASSPKYYGLPKVHKTGIPLRPIVSSVGSVSYETAKELSKILKPLVGNTPYSVRNTKDFIHSIQDLRLQDDECMVSYDVEALFTSVPVKPAIAIIQKKLEADKDLHLRTTMSPKQIVSLLEFCLTNTYFTYQGKLYEQTDGTAMGSPISPIVANLFMEDLEIKALATSPHKPSLWKRFVDDTFIIIKKAHKDSLLQHLNSIDSNIKFTCEESRDDGSIPFLDILIIPGRKGKLDTTVYRKPTHTDLYLQWDSHHNIPAKYSVIGTLLHRAKTICSSPQHLQREEQHLTSALKKCKYPSWALNRIQLKNTQEPANRNNNRGTKPTRPEQSNINQPHIVVPYHQGLSKNFKRTCNKYGVQVHLKGGLTIKNLLMSPKDKDTIWKKSGVIYRYKCNRVDCEEEYIGESARNFAERFKEHLKTPSPIHDHCVISGHNVTIDNFEIVGREGQNLLRTIKEALYIRVNNPSLNKNIGKYHLPHIWDEVLHNISELKLK